MNQSFGAYVKRQFKKNKRALFSAYMVGAMALLAIFADFIANEKPLFAKHEGKTMFPIIKQYGVDLGLTQWDAAYQNIQWKDLEYESVVWPLIPYSPTNLDYANGQYTGPFDDQVVQSKKWWHWLGTDELGRDVLSGMIHATRIALSVGLISMGIASLIGIFLGSMAGFFGDDRLKMSRIRFFLNIAFFFLALFLAIGARKYNIADAFNVSAINGIGQILLSVLIFLGVMALANLITIPLKKIKWLGERIAAPVDLVVSRMMEIMVSVPRLFLIISVVAVISKPSLFWVMVIIGAVSWTGIARLIRAELLKVRQLEYLEAAQALGYNDVRQMLKHAVPNALNPVFIAVAFGIAAAILVEAFLSFIGIGVPAETVTWGSLLNLARSASNAWWLAIFPGFAIFITVTLFNLIGEGLTDALDPRMKK